VQKQAQKTKISLEKYTNWLYIEYILYFTYAVSVSICRLI